MKILDEIPRDLRLPIAVFAAMGIVFILKISPKDIAEFLNVMPDGSKNGKGKNAK